MPREIASALLVELSVALVEVKGGARVVFLHLGEALDVIDVLRAGHGQRHRRRGGGEVRDLQRARRCKMLLCDQRANTARGADLMQ